MDNENKHFRDYNPKVRSFLSTSGATTDSDLSIDLFNLL